METDLSLPSLSKHNSEQTGGGRLLSGYEEEKETDICKGKKLLVQIINVVWLVFTRPVLELPICLEFTI